MKALVFIVGLVAVFSVASVTQACACKDVPGTLTVSRISGRDITIRYTDVVNRVNEIRNEDGEVVKRFTTPRANGTKVVRLPEGTPSGEYSIVQLHKGEGWVDESFTYTLPPPTCSLKASEKRAAKGDFITLRWTSERASERHLFGKKVEESGTQRVALYHAGPRGFSLNLKGEGGIGSCSTKVFVR